MAIFCIHCGKELEDGAAVCPQCGNAVTEMTEPLEDPVSAPQEISPEIPEEAPKGKRIKWWMIAVPAVLVIGIILALILPGLSRPELELLAAAKKTGEDLMARLEGSPISVNTMNDTWNSGMTLDADIGISMGLFGDMQLGIDYANDPVNQATSTLINFNLMGQSVKSGTFVGKDDLVFVLQNAELGTGDPMYFGLSFATFEEDMKKNSMFSNMEPEILETFIESVHLFQQQQMDTTDTDKAMEELAQKIKTIITDSEWTVAKESLFYQDKEYKSKSMTIRLEHDQLGELFKLIESTSGSVDDLSGAMEDLGLTAAEDETKPVDSEYDSISDMLIHDAQGGVHFRFYIFGGKIIAVECVSDLVISGEASASRALIILGENAATGDITVISETPNDDQIHEVTYVISPVETEAGKGERITTTTKNADGTEETTALSFVWNSSTGAFTLEKVSASGETATGTGVLTVADDEIYFQMDNLYSLLDTEDAGDMGELLSIGAANLTITIKKGASVTIPEYINIDEWDELPAF